MVGSVDVLTDLKTLPFDDNYADLAVSIHVLEHFYYWEVDNVLNEWKRVLKPGGKLVLELPCMNKIIKYMADCLINKEPMMMRKSWLALWGDPTYGVVEMTHKWGWTKEALELALTQAGFRGITHEIPRYHMKSRDMRVECYK